MIGFKALARVPSVGRDNYGTANLSASCGQALDT